MSTKRVYKQYTPEEKLAYYKKKALAKSSNGSYQSKSGYKKIYPKRKYATSSYKKREFSYAPIGQIAGSMFGPAGGAVGGMAGKLLDSISGHGSYKINKNTVYQNSVPQFASHVGDGCIRMKHKEFISDVITSPTAGLFQNNQYAISASNPATFPYLSQIAVNFEEFMFEGLVFSYVPSSGSLSTTGQLGTIIMATQYNSAALPFTNKQQAEASTYSISQVVSSGCLHPIECDSRQTPSQGIFYNSRPGQQVDITDIRWQQLGNLNVMTQGAPNSSEDVGELWVSYDVVLCKPILQSDDSEQYDHYVATAGISGSVYYGTNPTLTNDSTSAVLNPVFATFSNGAFTSLNGSVININPAFNGSISVSYALHGSSGTWVDPTFGAGTGVSPLLILNSGGTQQYVKTSSTTSLELFTTAYFTVLSTGSTSTITISGGTFVSPTLMDLIITALPATAD